MGSVGLCLEGMESRAPPVFVEVVVYTYYWSVRFFPKCESGRKGRVEVGFDRRGANLVGGGTLRHVIARVALILWRNR